jgi:hypothetical protein
VSLVPFIPQLPPSVSPEEVFLIPHDSVTDLLSPVLPYCSHYEQNLPSHSIPNGLDGCIVPAPTRRDGFGLDNSAHHITQRRRHQLQQTTTGTG